MIFALNWKQLASYQLNRSMQWIFSWLDIVARKGHFTNMRTGWELHLCPPACLPTCWWCRHAATGPTQLVLCYKLSLFPATVRWSLEKAKKVCHFSINLQVLTVCWRHTQPLHHCIEASMRTIIAVEKFSWKKIQVRISSDHFQQGAQFVEERIINPMLKSS